MINKKFKERTKTLSKNLIFFIISKGVAFFTPILFVRFVTLKEYGIVEFSYSFGSIMAAIFTFGLGGAYPYFILKKSDISKEQLFYFHPSLVFVIWLIFTIIFYLNLISISIYLPLLFCVLFALQRLYSAILKSQDKGYLAVIFDGGYYFVLTLMLCISFFYKNINIIKYLRIGMEVYFILLFFIFFRKYLNTRTVSCKVLFMSYYPEVIKFSYHLVISGLLIFCLTSTPRIYIKYLLGYTDVGIYSFYFRLAGMAVIIHMFISIAFFKKLYLSSPKQLDKYYSSILCLVCLIGVISYMISPFIIRTIFPDFLDENDNSKLLLLLCFQMPIWVGISLNESIISRENLVPKMNKRLIIIVILIPLTLALYKSSIDLNIFTIIYILFFCIAYTMQILILRKKNIYLRRCLFYNMFTVLASLLIFYIY